VHVIKACRFVRFRAPPQSQRRTHASRLTLPAGKSASNNFSTHGVLVLPQEPVRGRCCHVARRVQLAAVVNVSTVAGAVLAIARPRDSLRVAKWRRCVQG